MITIDLHSHTKYAHGINTPQEMFSAAQEKGITLLGFSEHAPRPLGYNYTREYREHLTKYFSLYIAEVNELKAQHPGKVLLGLEMDWMDGEEVFISNTIKSADYDYIIGSVHFLNTWGYDDNPVDWHNITAENSAMHYEKYFQTCINMAKSGFFQIAAHLDLIKIFSMPLFNIWLQKPHSLDLIGDVLKAIKNSGMAMEISSAGLRKPCKEIYPNPKIMALAKDLNVPISFGSDAHNVKDAAFAFDTLASYASSFGYKESVWFKKNQCFSQPF